MWDYKRDESRTFKLIPEGDYRIRVKSVEKAVSKDSGNDMLSLQFEVSGKSGLLFHHIAFLKDRPEVTNRMLTSFFDSFAQIADGDFNLDGWVGKVGACHVKHEEYNGNVQAKIHYFISADKQGSLPAWVEPERSDDKSDGGTTNAGFAPIPDGMDVPFH